MSLREADKVGEKEFQTGTEAQNAAEALGERIVRLRQRRGWSRVELARRLGVRRDRLAKWELGKNPPPLAMLAPLARALGMTVDELVTGEPPAGDVLTAEQWKELAGHVEALRRLLKEPRIAMVLRAGTPEETGRDER
jgi:transcriptional regulator with XRE-family HTH domain